jgi:putative ABC transport system ATP-binding protein
LKGIRPFAFGMLLGSLISAARKQDVMIRLKNIVRYFENKFQRSYVLKDISLEINKGEFVTIMGPSGAGKTTLLNIIGLLDEPSSGEYFLNDEATHALRERKKATIHKDQIGFVFQAYHLIDELNVYENIETPLLYRTVNAKERKALVADTLEHFGLSSMKDLFPAQLSGGQQQMVGVARAVIGKPTLLLADEPTGNLHSDQGLKIMRLFKQLNEEGLTIVQVTHSASNAQFGNRIIELADGVVKQDQKTKEIIFEND